MNALQKTLIATCVMSLLPGLSFAAIPKGNGIFIDDVSYDMFCSGSGSCQGVTERLKPYQSAKFLYFFPDFGYISQVPPAGTAVNHIDDCGQKPTASTAYTYNALPPIKPSILPLSNVLGTCDPGKEVTAHYNVNGQTKVLPIFTAADASMFDKASPEALTQLATAIANTIIDDPNVAGVAFDIEPAFKSLNATEYFYGTIAEQLQQSGKIIAIFDANRIDLAKVVADKKLDNVLVLDALYDFGEFPNYQLNQAIPLANYDGHQGYASKAKQFAQAYFGDGSQPQMKLPVMFVLPASATSTIWDHLQFYNTSLPPKGPADPYKGVDAASCYDNPSSWLNQFLQKPAAVKTTLDAAHYFVSPQNCKAYVNPNKNGSSPAQFMDYFNASLAAVSGVKNQDNYIGSALYTVRAEGASDEAYYDTICAKNYYSIYDTKSLYKQCIGVFPSNITDSVLETFTHWNSQ